MKALVLCKEMSTTTPCRLRSTHHISPYWKTNNMPTHDTIHILEWWENQKFSKDFDTWNDEKKIIDQKDITKIICRRWQFWLCKIGENIGSEISKSYPYIRPVLILNTRFRGGLVLVVPMTTKPKEKAMKYYHHIYGERYGLDRDSYCMLDQIRVISRKRLVRRLNDIHKVDNTYIPLYAGDELSYLIEQIKSLL